MKIKTRFVLIFAAAGILPFFVLISVILLQVGLASAPGTVRDYLFQQRWLRSDLLRAAEEGRAEEAVNSAPRDIEAIVVANSLRVLASTVDQAEVGELLVPGSLAEVHGEGAVEFLTLPFTGPEGSGFIAARFPASTIFYSLPFRNAVFVVLPVILVAAVAAASLWVTRGLRNSVVALKGAADKIAEGDLNFALPVPQTGTNDELISLVESFDSMRQTVKEEYARRARFTMAVSHDLKTPLSLIQGYAEAIEDGHAKDAKSLKRYLGIIREKSDLLYDRIVHLIEFLRLETGEWLASLEAVHVASFFADLAERFAADASFLDRPFESRIDVHSDKQVPMDQALVTRAFENLLSNALRHGTTLRPVILEVTETEEGIAARMVSSGDRVEVEDVDLWREPFFRVDNARNEPGSGLGLSIVSSVLRHHGWRLLVRSYPEPKTPAPTTAPESPTTAQESPAAGYTNTFEVLIPIPGSTGGG